MAGLCAVAFSTGLARSSSSLTLEQRVLRPSEFKGFSSIGPHPVIRSASAWSGGNLPLAALRKNGFVAGVREELHARALNADGLSVAAQFRTAKGAQAEVRAELAYFRRTNSLKHFSVRGIPGAYGYSASSAGFRGYNVYFTDGAFQFLVGAGFSTTASKKPSKAKVISAAAALYRRVHRHPAP
jgi:hypothetical protein